ncbi:MAG: LOG family protein [Bacilli bacterium]
MNVFIACSSKDNIDEKFYQYAKEVSNLLIETKDEVFVGGKIGIMGFIANYVRKNNIEPNIVITKKYQSEIAKEDKKVFIAESVNDRINYFLNKTELFIVFPGSLGTLNELFMALESKRTDGSNLDIILLNIDGFYDDVIKVFENHANGKFFDENIHDFMYVARSINELKSYYKEVREKR